MIEKSDAVHLFPQGHAIGSAFCNREKERARLKTSFLNNEHTVIVAPRRYGKSSLIRQVLMETMLPGKRLDLLPATNVSFVHKAIKSCFSELINEIAPKTKNTKQKLAEFLKNAHPKLTLSIFGQKLEVNTLQPSEESVMELLVGLNDAASKTNRRLVVCLDEFQQIGLLKDHHALEAAIRHAVESSSHVTYVFSGSNRNLLHQMFSTKSRPLYHLCELMELKRISAETYYPFLLERAKKRWKGFDKNEVIYEIINLTKCHPYYINALCRQLWKLAEQPTNSTVQKTWFNYVETQSNWITDDLAKFTPNQRNILAGLAYQAVEEPYKNGFSEKMQMGPSSIKAALDVLMKNDFVYKDEDKKFKVLDPALETYLNEIKYFNFIDD